MMRGQSAKRRHYMVTSHNILDDRGWTPLHIEARKGNLEEVRRLLNEGADVNVPALGPKFRGATPLHFASAGGHLEVMDELLKRGADIDARTKGGVCGWTPLHCAAKERNKKAMEFLIENGAFLPEDMNDITFNPDLYYCPGLEWAYEFHRGRGLEWAYEFHRGREATPISSSGDGTSSDGTPSSEEYVNITS